MVTIASRFAHPWLRTLAATAAASFALLVCVPVALASAPTYRIPTGISVCAAPSGSISGTSVGPARIGERVGYLEAHFPRFDAQRFSFERFCMSGGGDFRVESPAANQHLGTPGETMRGRVIMVLTANPHYDYRGVRPGSNLSAVAARLKLEAGLHVGRDWWYLAPGAEATVVFKVRGGVVEEIGLADKLLTESTPARRRFFGL